MNLLLDSYPFLELLNPASKADKVKELIHEADRVFTTVLNLYEVKYRVTQRSSIAIAESFISTIRDTTQILGIDEKICLAASELKLKYPKLGAIDCHTFAVAQKNDYILVTGDTDFPESDKIIQI